MWDTWNRPRASYPRSPAPGFTKYFQWTSAVFVERITNGAKICPLALSSAYLLLQRFLLRREVAEKNPKIAIYLWNVLRYGACSRKRPHCNDSLGLRR